MAMIDYGAVAKKNGIVINRGQYFMDMETSVGFILDSLKGVKNEIEHIRENWFVYFGDKELLVCIYKTQILVICNGEIKEHIYRMNDDYLSFKKYRLKFSVNNVDFDIKKINDSPRYYVRFWYKNDLYECIYGYGVDSDINQWYGLEKSEKRYVKKFFTDKERITN